MSVAELRATRRIVFNACQDAKEIGDKDRLRELRSELKDINATLLKEFKSQRLANKKAKVDAVLTRARAATKPAEKSKK